MKIKNTKVYGLEESIVRSGYPMQVGEPEDLYSNNSYFLKELKTLDLYGHVSRAKKLGKVKSGIGHDNYLKGIIVQFDLQYPEYFSPQLQRYSWVDIISSQSKMHKITSRPLTQEDFTERVWSTIIKELNSCIEWYNSAIPAIERRYYFDEIISNLPCGYLKWMGISTNYLQLKTIYWQRKNHKLSEWQYFCNWIEELPRFKELVLNIKENEL